MPRGKKNKRKNNQDDLTTRLMQLSLKMDDHIYCNKLIPVTAAEEYLQEIASLKLKCPRTNARALQVIEKLTRYMKGVIAGDQIPAGYVPIPHVGANRESPEPCSPVYSLADEDKTELFTEESFVDDQLIDLTEEDAAIQKHDKLIEKVKNAISNMGLRDETQVEIADVDSSQSILDKFHNDNTVCDEISRQPVYYVLQVVNNQSKQVSNEVVGAANNNPVGPAIEQNCSQSVLDIFYSQNTKCSEASQDKDLEIYQNITETNLITQPTLTKEINNTITFNDTLTTPQTMFFVEAPIISEKNISNVKRPPTLSRKESSKGRRKKNKDAVGKQKSQSKMKNKAKKTTQENIPNKGTFDIVPRKEVIRSDVSVDNTEIAIYNENVECDLSWIENLRYVRENSPEENDTTLRISDDNFWNNFNLPESWNDRDFEI